MKRCGLLGEKLGHSYSPAIHAELADYEYRLYEVAPEKLGEFLTGGGCVTREENYDLLHQNGIIFWLERDVDKLPREGRPLSAGDLAALYDRRRACYERFADHVIDNNGTVEQTVQAILDILQH